MKMFRDLVKILLTPTMLVVCFVGGFLGISVPILLIGKTVATAAMWGVVGGIVFPIPLVLGWLIGAVMTEWWEAKQK